MYRRILEISYIQNSQRKCCKVKETVNSSFIYDFKQAVQDCRKLQAPTPPIPAVLASY